MTRISHGKEWRVELQPFINEANALSMEDLKKPASFSSFHGYGLATTVHVLLQLPNAPYFNVRA
jgi:hypothetical protein